MDLRYVGQQGCRFGIMPWYVRDTDQLVFTEN